MDVLHPAVVSAIAANLRQQRKQSGGRNLAHFRSTVAYQRGRGLGGLLRSLFRTITPIFKKPIVKQGLKSLGKSAATAMLEAGQKALDEEDVRAFGPALRDATKKQVVASGKRLASRILTGQGPSTKRKNGISRTRVAGQIRRGPTRDIFQNHGLYQ